MFNKKKVKIEIHNLRDYAFNKHKQIDDKPFGGGAGMVLKPEPFIECIENLQSKRKFDHIIFADVLEHLYDPYKVLKESVALLKDDGTILISIPNISCVVVLDES